MRLKNTFVILALAIIISASIIFSGCIEGKPVTSSASSFIPAVSTVMLASTLTPNYDPNINPYSITQIPIPSAPHFDTPVPNPQVSCLENHNGIFEVYWWAIPNIVESATYMLRCWNDGSQYAQVYYIQDETSISQDHMLHTTVVVNESGSWNLQIYISDKNPKYSQDARFSRGSNIYKKSVKLDLLKEIHTPEIRGNMVKVSNTGAIHFSWKDTWDEEVRFLVKRTNLNDKTEEFYIVHGTEFSQIGLDDGKKYKYEVMAIKGEEAKSGWSQPLEVEIKFGKEFDCVPEISIDRELTKIEYSGFEYDYRDHGTVVLKINISEWFDPDNWIKSPYYQYIGPSPEAVELKVIDRETGRIVYNDFIKVDLSWNLHEQKLVGEIQPYVIVDLPPGEYEAQVRAWPYNPEELHRESSYQPSKWSEFEELKIRVDEDHKPWFFDWWHPETYLSPPQPEWQEEVVGIDEIDSDGLVEIAIAEKSVPGARGMKIQVDTNTFDGIGPLADMTFYTKGFYCAIPITSVEGWKLKGDHYENNWQIKVDAWYGFDEDGNAKIGPYLTMSKEIRISAETSVEIPPTLTPPSPIPLTTPKPISTITPTLKPMLTPTSEISTHTPVPSVTPTPTPAPPGFEAIFAIAGLLMVVYLLKRKR